MPASRDHSVSLAPRSRLRRRLRRTSVTAALLLAALSLGPVATAAESPAYTWGKGTLTGSELHSLVSQMALPEETGMVHGSSDTTCATTLPEGCAGQAGWIPGVARLGVPPLRMTDGPAGVRLAHVETALPAPVGLAATFDSDAARTYGTTVGAAGRATGQDVWLGPMVNAVNYPTGGRNFETLGEDPYLAGRLAAQEVRGAQSKGLVAELKHYVENDFENGRNATSVTIDDQTFHETELVAFEAGIRAGAGSIMCSYNRINDIYGCGDDDTLIKILRQQLAFTGFVQSDWGAVHKITDLVNGTDIEQPSAPQLHRPGAGRRGRERHPGGRRHRRLPGLPGDLRRPVEERPRHRRLPHPVHDERGRPPGGHAVRLPLHQRSGAVGAGPPEPVVPA